MKRLLPLLSVLLVLSACKSTQVKPNQALQTSRENQKGKAKKPSFPYRTSETKAFDLIHTRLEVDFVWEKEQMNGKAWLKMHPWFSTQSEVTLDAKGYLINSVGIVQSGQIKQLKYDYTDLEHLKIMLDRDYQRSDTIEIFVDYVARPSKLGSLLTKEGARDQGLYFINPRKEVEKKPQQIWTQGESNGSPAWFPTFDTPNQKCTQEIAITIADNFTTLSNGLLIDSKKHSNGTRTDFWKMSLPHSPYLFMMAIGEFSIVKDTWRGKEVNYYVEPEFEQYAQLIFGNTPEMLEFYSNKLGVEFPWEKYGQVVVRDFVSGAMENTSATTHFGGLQHDTRQHLDRDHEDIIAHELFHQWFGDLVTCESWANLTLNEGFATYGEYLWIEYKYGKDAAMRHLINDRNSYMREAKRKRVPLIRYSHERAGSMFDAHSYQKGGQVLHMLRQEVGDEAFFASLKYYLTENAFRDVEVHKLRLAFEEITGRDLSIYFNQWYLAPGHPELAVSGSYADGKYDLTIRQLQDTTDYPVYQLPIEIEVYANGQKRTKKVIMSGKKLVVALEAATEPDYVFLNPKGSLLAEIKANDRSQKSWKNQLRYADDYYGKSIACENIEFGSLSESDFTLIEALSKDPFWGTRLLAAQVITQMPQPLLPKAINLANTLLKDEKSSVRAAAVTFFLSSEKSIGQKATEKELKTVREGLSRAINDSSYAVCNNALRALQAIDQDLAVKRADELALAHNPFNAPAIAKVYMKSNRPEALSYIASWVNDPKCENGVKSGMFRGFGTYLKERPEAEQAEGIALLKSVILESSPWWLRFSAIQAMTRMGPIPEVKSYLENYQASEENDYVKGMIKRYLKESK